MQADIAQPSFVRRSFAILAGGGVKGAALAGCLAAAEEFGFQFKGYAGTSAGSIVSLLACLGYTGREIGTVLSETPLPSAFLEPEASKLQTLLGAVDKHGLVKGLLRNHMRTLWLIKRLRNQLGVCEGHQARELLTSVVGQRLSQVNSHIQPGRLTFREIRDMQRPILKILASDISERRAYVYSSGQDGDNTVSVIDAVRASISYPLMFQPVRIYDRYLVDGGLTANLPFFLFEEEQRAQRLPTFAFDLVEPAGPVRSGYDLGQFALDLAATALQSAQRLHLARFRGVYLVQVMLPVGISTFTSLTREDQENLYQCGYDATMSYLDDSTKPWKKATDRLRWLQALWAEPRLIRPILQTFADEVAHNTPATNVRANVMLPTGENTRMILYQYGMEGDADEQLELGMTSGCSGHAWESRKPAWADLEAAQTNFATIWGMTEDQQSRIRPDRRAVFSIPIFEPDFRAKDVSDLGRLGVLSVDTDASLSDTLWMGEKQSYIYARGRLWADVLARVLTNND